MIVSITAYVLGLLFLMPVVFLGTVYMAGFVKQHYLGIFVLTLLGNYLWLRSWGALMSNDFIDAAIALWPHFLQMFTFAFVLGIVIRWVRSRRKGKGGRDTASHPDPDVVLT